MVEKQRRKCAAPAPSELGDVLSEFEGIADDAQGLIEVEDCLV